MTNIPWPTEHEIELGKLWSDGLSASKIAEALCDEFGATYTRSAICGKVARLNLTPRATTVRNHRSYRARVRLGRPTRSTVVEEFKAAPQIIDEEIPLDRRLSFDELTKHTCKWPVSDPGTADFFFCGDATAKDKPYCPGHCKRAYVKPEKAQNAHRRNNFRSTKVTDQRFELCGNG